MKFVAVLAFAFLIVLAPLAHAEEPAVRETATPPLWVVERNGATLYLFGSLHLLPPNIKWEREELTKARAASQVFVFEAPLDDGGAAMARVVERSGKLPFGKTLKDMLPQRLHEDLDEAAWRVQYPPKLLAPLRPWLAAVYLELFGYIKLGFSSYYGVDHLIELEAKERGAERAYLESVEEQLSKFAQLSRHTELAYLKAAVRGILEEPNLPIELVNGWAAGDAAQLAKLIDHGFNEVPVLRAQLLIARNRNWVPQLEAMLASGKTHFVTVGIGHLVGRDSVVAMLRARGYKVSGP
jgi:uncharacterized protein YbaP (TraB family)